MTRFLDFNSTAPLTGVNFTEEGYLEANAFVVRTGLQSYQGKEIDPENRLGIRDKAVVTLLRSPEEVFHKDSIASFARKPMTNDHPSAAVVADNWKELAIGETDSEILRDGESLRIPFTIRATKDIQAIKDGRRELSAGYDSRLDMTPGIYNGQPYDGIQREIRCNHIAVVDRGRAGPKYRIGDSAFSGSSNASDSWGAAPITVADKGEKPMTLRKMLVDGLTVETTEAGEQAIIKLQNQVQELTGLRDAADRELAAAQADLKKAQDAIPTPEALSAMVADRASLLNDAQTVASIDYSKAGNAEDIRRMAVAAKLGDAAVKDRSDAYVEVRFDDLLADAKKAPKQDPVRRALGDGVKFSDGGPSWDDALKINGYQA